MVLRVPADLERELRSRASRLGLRGRRRRPYIYGTLARIDRARQGGRYRVGVIRRGLLSRIRRIL